MNLLEPGIRPRQIMTKEAFENAIAVVHGARRLDERGAAPPRDRARGAAWSSSSTTSTAIGAKVPHIADTKPHGKYHMVDIDGIGGVPVVMRELLEAGLLHGDVLTVTGKTMAENLDALDPPKPDGEVVHPLVRPDPRPGRDRDPARLARAERRRREGRRASTSPASTAPPGCSTARTPRWRRSSPGKIKAGDIVVIRYEGPKGGPGMREMLAVTGAMKGAGRGEDAALITDGRFCGGTHGFCVGHVAPEAVDGGPIAFVADGDRIVIDADAHTIDLLVDDAELARRRKELEAARAAVHERLPRQVRPARAGRREGRDHQRLTRRRSRHAEPPGRERAENERERVAGDPGGGAGA